MKLLALIAFTATAAARKAPKKFESAKEVALNAPALEAKGDQLFCVAPPDAPVASLIFGSITWDTEFKPISRGRARAVSDDDFHEAGWALVGKLVGADGNVGKQLDAKLAKRPLFPMPWDSCPNPFSDCVLDLSPYGNSCARVSSREPYKVRVKIDRGFPIRPIMVLAGIALLAAAHALSANVPFQYGSAVVMGECVALCLIVLYFIRRAGGGFKSKVAAAGLYGLLVLRKGSTIVRKTLLDHWELAFVYVILVAMASCWVVGVSRKTKASTKRYEWPQSGRSAGSPWRSSPQRVQGPCGPVRHVPCAGRSLRADACPETHAQEAVLPRGEDQLGPDNVTVCPVPSRYC